MMEREVVFVSAGFHLHSSMNAKEGTGRSPCVLMIMGSGLVDRNENQSRLAMLALEDEVEP